MIYHIVSFQLVQDDASIITQVKQDLMRLQTLSYPIEFSLTEEVQKGGEIILYSTFKTQELLDAYMEDSLHRQVIAKTSPLIKQKQVFDFSL